MLITNIYFLNQTIAVNSFSNVTHLFYAQIQIHYIYLRKIRNAERQLLFIYFVIICKHTKQIQLNYNNKYIEKLSSFVLYTKSHHETFNSWKRRKTFLCFIY